MTRDDETERENAMAVLIKTLAVAATGAVLTATGFAQSAREDRGPATFVPIGFSGRYEHRVIQGGVGHNLPQEAPQAFAQAVVDVDGY